MKRRLVLASVIAVLASMSVTSLASAANTKGPYDGASPDSGTCGNDWANDTYKRKFAVSNDGGVTTLREDYIAGKFVTLAGASPGGCQGGNNGLLVTAGIKGEFSGFISGPVTGGTYNPDATCADPCTGTTWVLAFFGPGATWDVQTFDFDYHANGAGKLLFSRWQNASLDQGGNVGDIATS